MQWVFGDTRGRMTDLVCAFSYINFHFIIGYFWDSIVLIDGSLGDVKSDVVNEMAYLDFNGTLGLGNVELYKVFDYYACLSDID